MIRREDLSTVQQEQVAQDVTADGRVKAGYRKAQEKRITREEAVTDHHAVHTVNPCPTFMPADETFQLQASHPDMPSAPLMLGQDDHWDVQGSGEFLFLKLNFPTERNAENEAKLAARLAVLDDGSGDGHLSPRARKAKLMGENLDEMDLFEFVNAKDDVKATLKSDSMGDLIKMDPAGVPAKFRLIPAGTDSETEFLLQVASGRLNMQYVTYEPYLPFHVGIGSKSDALVFSVMAE